MKQLLRITTTYGGIYDDKDVKEVIITSQKELEEAIEENTRGNKPWKTLKFGEEGWTTADLSWSNWDDPSEVDFRLLNITAVIAKLEEQKANIDHKLKKYTDTLNYWRYKDETTIKNR